ncbi:MAG: hypothetical protein Kow0079_06860 [Vicingaceae bacterium]
MNTVLKYLTSVAVVLSFSSCTEEIDFDLNTKENNRLVVEGKITDQQKAHQIKLTRTTSYYYTESPPLETGAVVTITDGTNTYTLNETSPGIYETAPTVKGEINKTYTLNITTQNGEEYSATATMFRTAPIDTILVEKVDYVGDRGVLYKGYELQHFGPEPVGVGDYYLWDVYLNGQKLTDTISFSKLTFVSDEFVDGNYIVKFGVYVIDEKYINPGDTVDVTVELRSISKDYYNFLIDIWEETEAQQGLFSGPPANVCTNVTNGGLGFFEASAVTEKKIKVWYLPN